MYQYSTLRLVVATTAILHWAGQRSAQAVPPVRKPPGLSIVSVENTTGQDANDLHVQLNNLYTGVFGEPEAFNENFGPLLSEKQIDFATQSVDFSNGTVADGETVYIGYGTGFDLQLETVPFGGVQVQSKFLEGGVGNHYFTLDGVDIGQGKSTKVAVRAKVREQAVDLEFENQNSFAVAFLSTTLYSAPAEFYTLTDFRSNEALNNAEFHLGMLPSAGTIPPGGTAKVGTLSVDFLNSISGGVYGEPPPSEFSALSAAALTESVIPRYLALDVLFTNAESSEFLGQFTGAALLVPEPGSLALAVLAAISAGAMIVHRRPSVTFARRYHDFFPTKNHGDSSTSPRPPATIGEA